MPQLYPFCGMVLAEAYLGQRLCVLSKSFLIFCMNSELHRTSIAVMAIALLAIKVLSWAISVIAAEVNA